MVNGKRTVYSAFIKTLRLPDNHAYLLSQSLTSAHLFLQSIWHPLKAVAKLVDKFAQFTQCKTNRLKGQRQTDTKTDDNQTLGVTSSPLTGKTMKTITQVMTRHKQKSPSTRGGMKTTLPIMPQPSTQRHGHKMETEKSVL